MGNGELWRLARADMVERSGANNLKRMTASKLIADQVGSRLARRVGAGGTNGRRLVEHLIGNGRVAIDLATADGKDARLAIPVDDCLVQAAGGSQVSVPGGIGFLERPANMRIASEMKDPFRAKISQVAFDRRHLGEVASVKRELALQVAAFSRPLA